VPIGLTLFFLMFVPMLPANQKVSKEEQEIAKSKVLRSGFVGRVGSNDRNRLRALTVHRLRTDTIDFKRLRGWIDRCLSHHTWRCDRPTHQIRHLHLIGYATRNIVNVSKAEPSFGAVLPFIALSYFWGRRLIDLCDRSPSRRVDRVRRRGRHWHHHHTRL
jgi:hypothetical protein